MSPNLPFKSKRILIANRGEIAIRVARAIRELGHRALGLWTEQEESPSHLEFCDEWIKLEGTTVTETFLNIEQLVSICSKYKVDAVHPGYGFLSENAIFAEKLRQKGIVFIGPNTEAIRIMGDKAISKTKAKEIGVPVIPGSVGAIKNLKEAMQIADEIGYPVLLKAVAGGGGKGLRPCYNLDDLTNGFDAAKREAMKAFGNDALLVEKLIEGPRHIEVQVLGDKKGKLYHFYERECSIQRRHQKIIEEAPSPFIGDNEKLRIEICEAALKLARSVDYDSAGTVEFVMGEDKKYYFLEMNTRIQVEHAITEEITGIDLVVCMIQAGFGEDLGIPDQKWITKSGHSIECRLCAEDPVTMLPAPGKVNGIGISFPQGVRFDHALFRNLNVTADFDPMVGKLITKGITRDVAIRKMKVALKGLYIEGIKTNSILLMSILNSKNFLDGNYSTNFLEIEKINESLELGNSGEGIIEKLALLEAVESGL